MNHLQAFRQHSWHSPEWRSHKIEILVDDICCGNFSFQASSEQLEAAGGQEIQIEAVQVMVGRQKVSLDPAKEKVQKKTRKKNKEKKLTSVF